MIAALLVPVTVKAQAPETRDLQTTTLPDLLGRTVRVTGPATMVSGTLEAVHRQSLILSVEESDRTVFVGPTDAVWLLGNRKRSGAIAGALTGVALTAGFCIETFDECGLDVGLLVITPLFALAGAGFGSFRPMWEKIVP